MVKKRGAFRALRDLASTGLCEKEMGFNRLLKLVRIPASSPMAGHRACFLHQILLDLVQ